MDVDYIDLIALLANTPTQAESLLHSLEKATGSIGLHVNADKMEYMCLNQNQKGDISTLNGGSLKLVVKFTNLGSSVTSTENDIIMCLVKTQTAIDGLSVIWRSDLSDKIKCSFFPGRSCVHTAIWMHHMDADKLYREKACRQLHKNAASYNEQILEATSHKATAVWPPSHL